MRPVTYRQFFDDPSNRAIAKILICGLTVRPGWNDKGKLRSNENRKLELRQPLKFVVFMSGVELLEGGGPTTTHLLSDNDK